MSSTGQSRKMRVHLLKITQPVVDPRRIHRWVGIDIGVSREKERQDTLHPCRPRLGRRRNNNVTAFWLVIGPTFRVCDHANVFGYGHLSCPSNFNHNTTRLDQRIRRVLHNERLCAPFNLALCYRSTGIARHCETKKDDRSKLTEVLKFNGSVRGRCQTRLPFLSI